MTNSAFTLLGDSQRTNGGGAIYASSYIDGAEFRLANCTSNGSSVGGYAGGFLLLEGTSSATIDNNQLTASYCNYGFGVSSTAATSFLCMLMTDLARDSSCCEIWRTLLSRTQSSLADCTVPASPGQGIVLTLKQCIARSWHCVRELNWHNIGCGPVPRHVIHQFEPRYH